MSSNFLNRIISDIHFKEKHQRVIEIAVGKGDFSLALKKNFPDLAIVSLDKDTEYFKRRLENEDISGIEIAEGDAERISYDDDSFDWAFCHKFLHHLNETRIGFVIREMSRILKPSGKVGVVEQSNLPQNAAQRNLIEYYDIEAEIETESGGQPEKLYTEKEYKGFFAENGFEPELMNTYYDAVQDLSAAVIDQMFEGLEISLRDLPRDFKALTAKKLEGLKYSIEEHGLETLPLTLFIFRRKST